MARYVELELVHITDSLSGNNLFNLTEAPLNEDIQHWINKGGKYNPHVQKPIFVHLRQFDESFSDCINRIFRRNNFGRKVILDRSTIHKDLNAYKLAKPDSLTLVTSLQTSFTMKRRQFKNHLKRLQYSKQSDNLISDQELEDIFSLEDGRIIVESDKKLGYVILDSDTYLEAYHKINAEQHFEQVQITEEWYITNILNFIGEARTALPFELSNIVKPKDFDVDIESPSLGYLRLLPKIQKLKVVDHTQVHLLKCRGIKASLNDPITIVQKILDKIYSFLLFHIEEEFRLRFGRLSPSVSGVTEALDRIKTFKTGAWGTTAQLDAGIEPKTYLHYCLPKKKK